MTNLTDLLDPQGNASRVLIRYADRLLVVQHRDRHYPLSLDDNGATWSDDPLRLWDWHREVAAGHAAAIAGSDAAANEIPGRHRLPASGSHTAGDSSERWVPSDRPSSTCRTLRTSLRG